MRYSLPEVTSSHALVEGKDIPVHVGTGVSLGWNLTELRVYNIMDVPLQCIAVECLNIRKLVIYDVTIDDQGMESLLQCLHLVEIQCDQIELHATMGKDKCALTTLSVHIDTFARAPMKRLRTFTLPLQWPSYAQPGFGYMQESGTTAEQGGCDLG